MKLTNYKRGYNNTFDCSIHGTIYMTSKEWAHELHWLTGKMIIEKLFSKNLFYEDITRVIKTKRGQIINIRTTATGLLAEHSKLDNYKRGNYQLYILDK